MRSFCIVVLIAFISCDRKPDISGHWVSVPERIRNQYWTMDIVDSLLIKDKGSLTQGYGVDTLIVREIYLDSLPYWKGKEKFSNLFDVYYPGYAPSDWDYRDPADAANDTLTTIEDIPEDDPDSTIATYPQQPEIGNFDCVTIRNDTLIAFGDMFSAQFFVRRERNFRLDLFADLALDIELLEYSGQNCETRSELKWPAWISVGKSRIQEDTFRIQVNDVFIDATHICQYLDVEKLKFELADEKNFTIALSIDKQTPDSMVSEVIKTIQTCHNRMQIRFATIDTAHQRVCFVDSAGFFPLIRESRR